jgi:hypothetical protein
MRDMTKEWKKSTVIPLYKKADNQKLENYRGINLLNACYKLHSKILNEKFKARAEKYLLACQNGFRKRRACIEPLFSMELITPPPPPRGRNREREFNLETHLAFLCYVEAFENVKRQTLKYYTVNIFPIYY